MKGQNIHFSGLKRPAMRVIGDAPNSFRFTRLNKCQNAGESEAATVTDEIASALLMFESRAQSGPSPRSVAEVV